MTSARSWDPFRLCKSRKYLAVVGVETAALTIDHWMRAVWFGDTCVKDVDSEKARKWTGCLLMMLSRNVEDRHPSHLSPALAESQSSS